MVFSDAALGEDAANERFDHMSKVAQEIPFAKQPIIERASGAVIGYAGVDWFDLDGERKLEFGYRLASAYRGKGYATEASAALLASAGDGSETDIFALIHADNEPSQRVIAKLGFDFLRVARVDGEWRNLYLHALRGRG